MRRWQRTTIRVERRCPGSTKRVFEVWSRASRIHKLFAEAVPGGEVVRVSYKLRVSEPFAVIVRVAGATLTYTGEILEVEPSRKIVLTWVAAAVSKETTLVRIDVAPASSAWGGADVTVTHERVPPGEAEATRAWWTRILEVVASMSGPG
jgi:uncharacterized protein YndB with AHSA1/START domain